MIKNVKVRTSFWLLVCAFFQKGISVIITPILTRLLSTEEYGIYTAFNSWLGIVTVFVSMGLCWTVYINGLVRFANQRDGFVSAMHGLNFVLCTSWTIIYVLFIDFWNGLFSLSTTHVLAMISMIWASTGFNLWAGEQRLKYSYKVLAIVSVVASLAKLFACIGIAFQTHDKVTFLIIDIAIAESIVYFPLLLRQMRRCCVFCNLYFWRYTLRFNFPLIPHYLSAIILSGADRIMIKEMVGDSAAGIYGLAYSISLVMTFFNSALGQVLEPWIFQKIKDRKEKDIARVAYLSLLLIAGVNLALIVFAPEVIAIFAPPSYHAAIWVVPPVAMSALFIFSYDLFAKFEFYYEKTKFIMLASVAGAALNVLLNAIFISRYGYYAAGYTTLVCYMVYALAHYLSMRKICKTYLDGVQVYDPKRLLAIYAAFLACGFALLATYGHPVLRYGIAATALLLAFVRRRSLWKTLQTLLSLRK